MRIGKLLLSATFLSLASISVGSVTANADRGKISLNSDSHNRLIGFKAEGETLRNYAIARASTSQAKRKARVDAFLAVHRDKLGLSDTNITFRAGKFRKDSLGVTHARYRQYYKGLPVYGRDLIFHLNKKEQIIGGELNVEADVQVSSKASVSKAQAMDIALSTWSLIAGVNVEPHISTPKLTVLPAGLVFDTNSPGNRLAWSMDLSSKQAVNQGATYFVDADTGTPLQVLSNVREGDSKRVYECLASIILHDGFCHLAATAIPTPTPPGVPYILGRGVRPSANPTPEVTPPPRGPVPNYLAVPAQYFGSLDVDHGWDNLASYHDHILAALGRDGANYVGGSYGFAVNLAKAFERTITDFDMHYDAVDNCAPNHCCPNSRAIFLKPGGSGDGTSDAWTLFCNGDGSPDIVGHEYTHAMVYFDIDNAGTTYVGQAGALEESYADFGGVVNDKAATGLYDWKIGIWQNNPAGVYPSTLVGLVRDIANPASLFDPSFGLNYPDRLMSPNYRCGDGGTSTYVHHNSTVASKGYSLAVDGGDFNGCHINGIGLDPMEKIMNRAWETYFVQDEQFNAAYGHYITACNDLFSVSNPSYCSELTKALQAVELNQSGCGGTEVAPACAAHNEGSAAHTTNNTWYNNVTQYAPGEHIWVRSFDAVAGKTAKVYMYPQAAPNPAVPAKWAALSGAASATVTADGTGRFDAQLGTAGAEGSYYIIVDGNNDGFYQPWADTKIDIVVKKPVDADGVCFRGENYNETLPITENCFISPVDCPCPYPNSCNPINWNGTPTHMCFMPQLQRTPS